MLTRSLAHMWFLKKTKSTLTTVTMSAKTYTMVTGRTCM